MLSRRCCLSYLFVALYWFRVFEVDIGSYDSYDTKTRYIKTDKRRWTREPTSQCNVSNMAYKLCIVLNPSWIHTKMYFSIVKTIFFGDIIQYFYSSKYFKSSLIIQSFHSINDYNVVPTNQVWLNLNAITQIKRRKLFPQNPPVPPPFSLQYSVFNDMADCVAAESQLSLVMNFHLIGRQHQRRLS